MTEPGAMIRARAGAGAEEASRRPASAPTIRSALDMASRYLNGNAGLGPLEATVLLGHVLGRPRSFLYAWPELALGEEQLVAFEELVRRRAAGEPVAYLTGTREFWSLELAVSRATLIPRPETEALVTQALERIPAGARWRIADLGTGTGAVALAIARERPGCRVLATDLAPDALAVAAENARRNRIAGIDFLQGDWADALAPGRFECIVSNPPYVSSGEALLLGDGLPYEPPEALVAGPEGLEDIRIIVQDARRALTPGGWLLLEHGWDQGAGVRSLLQQAGYLQVFSAPDLEGRARISGGCRGH